MSQETLSHLNTQTLIGYTSQRGHAWHYRASEQSSEPNHYPGAVPVADVQRRLFAWAALEGEIRATALTVDGVLCTVDPDRKAIMRSDTGLILGVFKAGYAVHQYHTWLLESVAGLLDDDLQIGSAGVLRGGAQAWVSVEIPDTITTPEGVAFRPHLLAATSHDGSLATTFQRVVTNVVCDNTMSAALGEHTSQRVKVRHSRYSQVKLQSARDALALVHTIADAFQAQVAELCATRVTRQAWQRILNQLAPLPDAPGRARTNAQARRDALVRLYDHDDRVAPWTGTAYGVLQAVNTYAHHEGPIRGAQRAERNMTRAISGQIDTLDAQTLETIGTALAVH